MIMFLWLQFQIFAIIWNMRHGISTLAVILSFMNFFVAKFSINLLFFFFFSKERNSTPTTRRTSRTVYRWSSTRKAEINLNLNLISYYLFSLNLPLDLKRHFEKFQNQSPGELREHHLGEVQQGRSKSKFNITLSYSRVHFFRSF